MVERKKMYAELETIAQTYNSVAEIQADQRRIVDGVFHRNPSFDYLKKDTDLSDRARVRSLEGIRKAVAEFMKKKGIKDMCDVFEAEHFPKFFYDDSKYGVIETSLKNDSVLRNRFGSNDKCTEIAEVVGCAYVNEIFSKKLVMSGLISSAKLNYIYMPDIPEGVYSPDPELKPWNKMSWGGIGAEIDDLVPRTLKNDKRIKIYYEFDETFTPELIQSIEDDCGGTLKEIVDGFRIKHSKEAKPVNCNWYELFWDYDFRNPIEQRLCANELMKKQLGRAHKSEAFTIAIKIADVYNALVDDRNGITTFSF
jgi:hypothetical protein